MQIERVRDVQGDVNVVLDSDDGRLDRQRFVARNPYAENLGGLAVAGDLLAHDRIVAQGGLDGLWGRGESEMRNGNSIKHRQCSYLVSSTTHVDLHLVERNAWHHFGVGFVVDRDVTVDGLARREAFAIDRGVHRHVASVQQHILLHRRAHRDHQVLLHGTLDDYLLHDLLDLVVGADGHLGEAIRLLLIV